MPWEEAAQQQPAQAAPMPWEEAAAAQAQQPGFIQRVQNDYAGRVANAQDLANRGLSGDGVTPLKGAEMGMQLVGGPIADVANEAAKSFYNATASDGVKQGMQQIGNFVAPAVNAVAGVYHQLPQDVQDFGNMVVTGANAAGAAIPATKLVSGLGPTVGEAASAAGNAAMAVPRGIAEGAGNLAAGVTARSGDELEAATQGMYADASKSYNQMRAVGATLNPQTANNLLNNINSAVASKVFIPELNPQTVGILNHLKTAVEQDGTIGLDQLDQYRRLLGRVPATEDGISAGLAKSAIDGEVNTLGANNLVNGTPDAVTALNQGRKTFQQASKFDDIATIVQKAAGDPNKLKAGLAKFMQNPENTIGWSPDEIAAGKDAANTSVTEGLMKLGGKFGFDPGASNQGTAWAGLTGGAALGAASGSAGLGALVPVAGTVARQGQKWLGRGKAENLLQTIESGVPQAPAANLNAQAMNLAKQMTAQGASPTAIQTAINNMLKTGAKQ